MQIHTAEASAWKWYGVKVLSKNLITGKPNAEKIDENYEDHQIFEESILLIKAKENEDSYINVYNQVVNFQFVDSLDAFLLCEDEEVENGTEIYSRFLRISKEESFSNVLSRYYPEVMEEEKDQIRKSFILRNKDFN
ncbi:S-ribosylhomocysteinase [Priestia megaterium]|uniref:S-ribosylhomocysteinase n=1 Tax=Priestia megaterium TaxID=1404 RepID=UPI000BF6AB5A|nr:S-ribosylhomocysteinase [Priestia megaterium]PFV93175.1 S-ribosylhomocysteinase [Priestia megaterium]